MELDTLETHKALARQAWHRGRLGEAEQIYARLEQEYERHGFHDGLLAIRYNRWLIALEAGDAPWLDVRARALVGTLQSRIAEGVPQSALSADISTALARRSSVAVALHAPETLASLDTAAALTARTPGPGWRAADADRLAQSPPRPAGLARLDAEDAARLVLSLAWLDSPSAPLLVERVRAAFAPLADADLGAPMRQYGEAIDQRDAGRAYQALVETFDRAVTTCPALAGDLLAGLTGLEADGLPGRLEYAPDIPRERRLRASVELHRRLGRALDMPGWHMLAPAQWRRVFDAASEALERQRVRAGRGAARGDDLVVEAELVLAQVEAAIRLGRPRDAREALDGVLGRARRGGYGGLPVLAGLLAAEADLAERAGERERAGQLWRAAADGALAGVASTRTVDVLAERVDGALQAGELGRVADAAAALAGAVRCGALPAAALDDARTLLALVRPQLSPLEHAAASLRVELTAARAGDAISALRAQEAAQCLDDREAIALSALALASAREQAGDEGAAGELLAAAEEALRCPPGWVRCSIETAVGLAHRRLDPARYEIHLRRAAEVLESDPCDPGRSPLWTFAPSAAHVGVDAAIAALMEDDRPALARRLARGGLRAEQTLDPSRADDPLRQQVRGWHRMLFAERLGATFTVGAADDPTEILAAAEAASPDPGRRPPEGERWVEFRVFDEWMATFIVASDGVTARRTNVSAADLRGRIAAMLSEIRQSGASRADRLPAANALHELLVEPLEVALEAADRVLLVPDGPLCSLPFAALAGEAFLGSRCTVAVARRGSRAGVDVEPPVAAPPARAVVVGDSATTRDLQLSRLVGPHAFEVVDIVDGDALGGGAQLVHLVGEVVEHPALGPAIALVEDDAPRAALAVADALRRAGVALASLPGPLEGPAGRAVISALLGGVRCGVLARHWAADEDARCLLAILREAATAEDPWAAAAAMTTARRAAIEDDIPVRAWAAYELYLGMPD